jgi:NitT/TauT family transport system permease protein
MGTNKRDTYLHVVIPASLPGFVSGLKQTWSFAWRALMSGEVMVTCIGLGYTLILGRELADINQVALVMIVIILLGVLVDKFVFSVIEKSILKRRGL